MVRLEERWPSAMKAQQAPKHKKTPLHPGPHWPQQVWAQIRRESVLSLHQGGGGPELGRLTQGVTLVFPK